MNGIQQLKRPVHGVPVAFAIAASLGTAFLSCPCSAQSTRPAATRPAATHPATTQSGTARSASTQPASSQPAAHRHDHGDKRLDALLTRIESASSKVKTLQAKLTYDNIQDMLGDEQRRRGKLVYVAGPPAKFAIHFDRLIVDGKLRPIKHSWIFDGQWLIERRDDKKQWTARQVVPPNAKPTHKDPLALGEGPFPVPVRFNKARILKRFDVAIIGPGKKDPPDTIHLKLVPKPNFRIDFDQIDLWYSKKTLMPLRVQTIEEDSEDRMVFILEDLRLGQKVDPKLIDASKPKGRGWLIEIVPWERGRGSERDRTRGATSPARR